MRNNRYISRILAVVLSIAMVVSALPPQTAAAENDTPTEQETAFADRMSGETEEEAAGELPHIVAEITESRTETTKTFRRSDGSYVVAAYEQPVHFETEAGEFEEIDNTFVLSEQAAVLSADYGANTRVYHNRAGRAKVELEEKDFYRAFSMEAGDERVSWSYEGMLPGNIEWEQNHTEEGLTGDEEFLTVPGANAVGVYRNAFAYTDLQYVITSEGMKENIILRDRRADHVWNLQVHIGSLTAVQKDEQTVELSGDEGEPVMVISAPLMADAKEKVSTDVTLSMSVSGDVMSLTMTADEEFLQHDDTVYPVTVDPYFYLVAGSDISISDTFLSEAKPSTSMRSNGMAMGSLIVGRESSAYGRTRGLLKLDTLPNLPAGSVITEASLILKNYYSYSGNKSMKVEVRKATGSWTESGATWNNSSSLYESDIQDYYIVPQNEHPTNLFDTWEITRLMKGWYEGTIPNYGVMLTALEAETATPASCTKYYSSNCPSYEGMYPTFLIVFRNNTGLEDYWTYHTQSVNGGTGYLNDYSGNLIFTVPITETTGANMPAGIRFVYNSSISDQHYRNNTKGSINGAGWKTTYGQRLDSVGNVTEYSSIASKLTAEGFDYVWLDADGTHHFFQRQSDGTYKDEDGLGLTMRTGQSYGSYTNLNIIEDKEGNKTVFLANGYLLYLGNHLNQMISLNYDGAKLGRIIDGAGRLITFGHYSTTITSITGPEGTVTFTYMGYNLTKIHYPDGTKMEFGYSEVTVGGKTYHLLSSVTGRDGIKIAYTYTSSGTAQQRCRVKSVTEYAADGTAGNSLVMDYTSQNSTGFIYNKTGGAVSETYQFNDWGHTTGVVGDDGSSSHIKYQTSSDSASRNKITQVGAGTKYVNNLLVNHSAEKGASGWSTSSWAETTVEYAVDTTEAYLGYRSFRVCQDSSNPQRCAWAQSVSITGGKTYTFSAYVKTDAVFDDGISGATLYAVIYSSTSQLTQIECDTQLTGNNDWQRLSITFAAPTEAVKVHVYGGLRYVNGTAWFDCLQLEENDTVSPYNLIENSSFDKVESWSSTRTTSGDGIVDGQIKIAGNPSILKNLYQEIKVDKAGVAFHMSASAKAVAAPYMDSEPRYFAIEIVYDYEDGTVDGCFALFNYDISNWQNVSLTAAPAKNNANKVIKYICAYVLYYNQVNTAYFDNIMVTMDETGTTYSYDSNGNLISSADNAKRQSTYTINNATDMVTSLTDSTNTVYSYTYDSVHPKQLTAAKENSTGVGFEYAYGTGNNAGNVERVRMGTVGSMTANPYMETGTEYTDNGAYVTAEMDQRGGRTEYAVDASTGQVNSVTDPAGHVRNYTYDATTKNLTGVSVGGAGVTYGYDTASLGNRLKSITGNGSVYNFRYDKWANLESVNIG